MCGPKAPVPGFAHAAARFTPIELVTTLAVIAVILALAMPGWHAARVNAAFSEARINYDGLGVASTAWYDLEDVAADAWLDADWRPDLVLTRTPRPWGPDLGDWGELGFEPDGAVRCAYRALGHGAAIGWSILCNVDGDDWLYAAMGHHQVEFEDSKALCRTADFVEYTDLVHTDTARWSSILETPACR